MLELFLEFFGEFLLQVLGELLLEVGLHSLAEPFRQRPNPYLAALGYAVFGAFLGGLSLWLLPQHLTPPGIARIVNLALTPVAVGLCMAAVGGWRARRGETVYASTSFRTAIFSPCRLRSSGISSPHSEAMQWETSSGQVGAAVWPALAHIGQDAMVKPVPQVRS